MRPDERVLLLAFETAGGKPPAFLRDIGEGLGKNYKRVAYLASKWCSRGWYNYGVTVDLGWLTDEGHAAAELEGSPEP